MAMTREEFNRQAAFIRECAYKEDEDSYHSGSADPYSASREADEKIDQLWKEVSPAILAQERQEPLVACLYCGNEVETSKVNAAGYCCYPADTSTWPQSEVMPTPDGKYGN